MDAAYLINAVSFYLRQSHRLKRARLDMLDDSVEAAAWSYARRAADRLERLQQSAPIPVPVKRRRDGFPDTR